MAESLSDRLRQAIRDCGTTRYALSKQLGVAESTLSRFLSGERGLTLEVLDKLADVLGLQVVVTVQKANRPSKRGPKKKGVRKVSDADAKGAITPRWQHCAQEMARKAFEDFFPSRRGVWFLDELGVLCVYNNSPYSDGPKRRDQETTTFRRWLKKEGIREHAYATYPEAGEDAGYTYAMLLDAGADRLQEVIDALHSILMDSVERSFGAGRGGANE